MPSMPTALFRTTDPSITQDSRYYAVGTLPDASLVIHAEPLAPIPEGATVYYDGTTHWTWGEMAEAFPLIAPSVTPHEWAGDPIAGDVTAALFPKLQGLPL